MTKKLTKRDHVTIWRFLQGIASSAEPVDGSSKQDGARGTQTVDTAKLQSTVDVRFGVSTILVAIALLVALVALPYKPWKWMFYLADFTILLVAVWFIDRGNRRLRNLIRRARPSSSTDDEE